MEIGKIVKGFFEISQYFIFGAVFSIVIYFYVLAPHRVDGSSMFPTYHNNDLVLVYKLAYIKGAPKRGDVVVFEYSPTENYIKRVVGLPGDTVSLMDGKYQINGQDLNESSYLASSVVTTSGSILKDGEQPYVVPQGKYFVSGDNRPGSTDSRDFGAIDQKSVEGKVVLIWFPFNRVQVVRSPRY